MIYRCRQTGPACRRVEQNVPLPWLRSVSTRKFKIDPEGLITLTRWIIEQ
jgi:hypothetical protein